MVFIISSLIFFLIIITILYGINNHIGYFHEISRKEISKYTQLVNDFDKCYYGQTETITTYIVIYKSGRCKTIVKHQKN